MNEAQAKLARQARALNMRHARGRTLPAIVLMTDDAREVDWVGAVSALPRGSAVIVRHRDPALRERLAQRLKPLCRAKRVALLIADDPALAQRVRADGIHLPEKRIGRLRGVRAKNVTWLVTSAAHSAPAVRRACDADAVFVSPVFGTASHPDRDVLGVVRFAALAREGRAVYALGGVDTKTIRRLQAHRIVGIGVIGGWARS
ncbi:MAG: thiamine phosphate synthase [Alphaproteobacteria bacterium]|nr:thiamine phosphate synthase [Alphaproteobacteria bacterium]